MSTAEKTWIIGPEPSEAEFKEDGTRKREVWILPVEEAFLDAFLRDVFEQHWQGIRFGPLIQGAAYEWRCPSAPTRIGLLDGYLTIMFANGGHFHLCIGENRGPDRSPTPADLRHHREPSKAQIFRSFGSDGKPLMWGFEMWNGKSEPMISIFFPNPFINDDDTLTETPRWERLATWRALSKKWLRRDAEALDGQGSGFGSKAKTG